MFGFFSRAENLNEITPPELHFKIITPQPIAMFAGTLIDYSIKLNGIPFNWKTEICKWEPPYCFVDQQVKGPYVRWHHTHLFEDIGNGQTQMTDRVEYLSPGWIFEPLITRLFVQQKVEAIFNYREQKLQSIFG